MSGRVAHQPAWVKLVATAAILAIAWILGQTMGHVLLVFTVSTILALLLNPLVRQLRRLRIPRGLADAGATFAPDGPPPAPPAPVTVTRELPGRIDPPTLRHPT